MTFISRSTMNCCIALWHRVGGRMFTYMEVKDFIPSSSQLVAMKKRGMVRQIIPGHGNGPNRQASVWQMTDNALVLAESEEGLTA